MSKKKIIPATPAKNTEIAPVEKYSLGGGVEGAERTTREMARWTPPIISPDQQFAETRD